MIELISLFLGLVVGPQSVEVDVGAEVARVELLLGGVRCAEIVEPPWVASCDFGPELRPQRLEAVAFDAAQMELGRAEQLVNVPRDLAEATLVLEPAVAGEPRRARLAWQATELARPTEVKISFDGQPLVTGDPERIELPAFDPEVIHFLRAELSFGPVVQTQAELVIGGGFGEEVTRELTAVVLTGAKRPPRPEQMTGWLEARGKQLRVAAVEQGGVDVLVVREKSELLLGNMGDLGSLRQGLMGGTASRRKTRTGTVLVAPGALTLDEEASVRFVFPSTQAHSDRDVRMEVVPVSLDVARLAQGDFLVLVADFFFPFEDIPAFEQRLTDAVAIAGVRAAARGRPRAVVLITAGDSRDVSRHTPAEIRRFLELLQVPLLVWAPLEAAHRPSVERWGKVEDISNGSQLRAAIKNLKETLDQQTIVWVEGGHLPTEVELRPQAAGFELVGRKSR